MFLSLQTIGKLILAVNVLITGGVIVAGGSLFMDYGTPARGAGAFELAPNPSAAEKPERQKSLDDVLKDITADKFIFVEKPAGPHGGTPVVEGAATDETPKQPASCPFKVKGIMLSTVESLTAAIVQILNSKEQRTVSAGDEVEGVEIVRIKTESVVVLLNDEETEVPLDISDEGAAPKGQGKDGNAEKRGGKGGRRGGRPNRAESQPPRDGKADGGPGAAPNSGAPDQGFQLPEGVTLPPQMPSPEELAKLPTSEIIKKLPPKLQEWWARLPQAEKEQWENRFRKRFLKQENKNK